MASDTFSAGDLTAIIGDNARDGQHRAGYNGVWSLTHKAEKTNLFVPTVAGLNFEHIFDGETLDQPEQSKIFFEPRNAPMEFKKKSDTEAELHQPPTPTFFLESWTQFKLVAPHYIDFAFGCRPTQHAFKRGYIGLFWASYIHAPDDKSMYLRGKDTWLQHCSPAHNYVSTVPHAKNEFEPTFVRGHRDCLYMSDSPLKYELPFFYGLFRDMTVIVMIDRTEGVRFTHSPSGGGNNVERQTTNPAWDFQYLIPKFDVNEDYGFKGRLVYRPKCSREDVLKEYETWKKG
ncbi:MAG TPA: hypothetical protein VHR66_31675 [Gemmataceae bacterium]|jgi:hypothetical protein|nr:hypothetical protein [Gemmataceae bacterium]